MNQSSQMHVQDKADVSLVWLSESNLGDLALSQYGLEAFLIPQQFDDSRVAPEIW